LFFPSVFVHVVAIVHELSFGGQSRGRRTKKIVWKPFHKKFLATPVFDLGDDFSPLAVIPIFFWRLSAYQSTFQKFPEINLRLYYF
jgi:hypothetical protein